MAGAEEAGPGGGEGEPGEAGASQGGSVGVLGWLGFALVNSAAWGIIGVSSLIQWELGFAISFLYTGLLVGLAVLLDWRYQGKYKQFVNLLWVLAGWFVFILGIYISVNALGPAGEDDSSSSGGSWQTKNVELETLLPSGSSAALRSWASESDWQLRRTPTFGSLGGTTFFGGRDAGGQVLLWRSDGASASQVQPELQDPYSFVEFGSRLYFSAQTDSAGRELWSISQAAAAAGRAELVKDVAAGSESGDVRHLYVDTPSSKLYFKAQFRCPQWDSWESSETVYESDGTAAGTVDLRAGTCSSFNGTSSGGSPGSREREPSRAQLWGVVFLACAPMLAGSGAVLVLRKMPGLFLNLFGGVLCAVVVIYLLAVDRDTSDMDQFLKWFITCYSGSLQIVLAAWSVRRPKPEPWLDELRSWAVVVVSATFFVIIHIDLEIPFAGDAWQWVVYCILSAGQMFFSLLVARTTPMVQGAIGAFVVAWKISYEIVDLIASGLSGEVKMLLMLGILAGQGVGIILAAIFYAGNKDDLHARARSAFDSCTGRGGSDPKE